MEANLRQFLDYPVEPDAEWQGGIFGMVELMGADRARSPLAGATVALWIACERQGVHAAPAEEGPSLEFFISSLLEFTETQQFGYRPAKICVTDEQLAMQLDELFEGSGTSVQWNPYPEDWSEVKEGMVEELGGIAETPALSDAGFSLLQLKAFAEASAAFYRAGLWQYLDSIDLLQIQTPKPPKYLKYAIVLGAARNEFGLGFYDSVDTHWGVHAQSLDLRSLGVFSVSFEPISEANSKDVAFWQVHKLPLETGDAFPRFLFYSRGEVRAPTAKELEFVTIVMTALAETTESEIDSGVWTKQVPFLDGTKRCKISIPDLVDVPDSKEWHSRGFIPEHRSNEQHFRIVQAAISQHEGAGLEELNELLNTQYTGQIDEANFPSATASDRADKLSYAAIATYGRRRVQLAREALNEDPTHVEAHVLLAEATFDMSERIALYRRAIELGMAQCAEWLQEDVGHFWEITQTRPLMRAKLGLAMSLAEVGETNEAIAEMQNILRLNKNDNMGVRYEIVPLYLSQDRDKEAIEILDAYPEETSSWLYLRAQVEFRNLGARSQKSRQAAMAAFRSNPHVVKLLEKGEPPVVAERYTLGSPEEASVIIQEQLQSWLETDGFIEWMVSQSAAWERESLKRDRERNRKRLAKKKRKKKGR